jgi:regulator of protease activity HflC (stomatin/prohibitin superfamily)
MTVVPATAKTSDPAITWRERVDDVLGRVQFVTYTILVVLLLLLGLIWPRMFITIPTGSHAVMYRYFGGGTVTKQVWGEGLHVIPPWDKLTAYETRLQQQTLQFEVLSDEGLSLDIDISVRFRPVVAMLGHLHQDVGPEYFTRMIQPDIMAHVRRTLGSRPAHEIYSSANDLLLELRRVPALARLDEGESDTSKSYVQIQEIKLVNIKLPAIVESAIAEKYRQEQLMLEYHYKLEREQQEAERKRTEAGGIRDYNSIIGELSPDVLRWRDLDATAELAKSANAKVLILGSSGGSTPLLFNVGDTGVATPAAAATTPAPLPTAAATPAP